MSHSFPTLDLKTVQEVKSLLALQDMDEVALQRELESNPALREVVSVDWEPPRPTKQEPGHKNRKQRRRQAALLRKNK